VAGPKFWNGLPVGLTDLFIDPDTFARPFTIYCLSSSQGRPRMAIKGKKHSA
jgi:hypothetical protein